MPSIAGNRSSSFATCDEVTDVKVVKIEKSVETRSSSDATPQKRRLRSNSAAEDDLITSALFRKPHSPTKWKSPRRCINNSPSSPANLNQEALHVSTAPYTVVCREDEQNMILEFCKRCIEQEKAGSLYVCGCPGTGKSLSMERVREFLDHWANEIEQAQQSTIAILFFYEIALELCFTSCSLVSLLDFGSVLYCWSGDANFLAVDVLVVSCCQLGSCWLLCWLVFLLFMEEIDFCFRWSCFAPVASGFTAISFLIVEADLGSNFLVPLCLIR
ncbi:AAA ATPase [Sarracenia purpurea var. burkii]